MNASPRSGFFGLSLASILLSCSGIFVAGTLTLAHRFDRAVPCGGSDGCAIVASDPSSQFLGIPTSGYGLIAYLTLAGLSLMGMLPKMRDWATRLALIVAGVACAVSIALTLYASLHLHATCRWCLGSLAIITLIFGSEAMAWDRRLEVLPTNWRRFKLGIAVLTVGLTLSGFGVFMMRRYLTTPLDTERIERLASRLSTRDLIPLDSHSIGSPKSLLTIVEFADLACPACRLEFPMLSDAVTKHPDRMRLVFRHLPLAGLRGHETSREAAIYSEMCPDDRAFFQFVRQVYSSRRPPSTSDLRSAFLRVGGKENSTVRGKAIQRVDRDRAIANQLHLNLTPSFLIIGAGSQPRYATSTNLIQVLSTTRD